MNSTSDDEIAHFVLTVLLCTYILFMGFTAYDVFMPTEVPKVAYEVARLCIVEDEVLQIPCKHVFFRYYVCSCITQSIQPIHISLSD